MKNKMAKEQELQELPTTHRESNLAEELFRERQTLVEHLGVKLVQRSLHHLHTDPHIPIPEECPIEMHCVGASARPHRDIEIH